MEIKAVEKQKRKVIGRHGIIKTKNAKFRILYLRFFLKYLRELFSSKYKNLHIDRFSKDDPKNRVFGLQIYENPDCEEISLYPPDTPKAESELTVGRRKRGNNFYFSGFYFGSSIKLSLTSDEYEILKNKSLEMADAELEFDVMDYLKEYLDLLSVLDKSDERFNGWIEMVHIVFDGDEENQLLQLRKYVSPNFTIGS